MDALGFAIGVPAAHLDHEALGHPVEGGVVVMLFADIAHHVGDAFGRAHAVQLQRDVAHRGRDQDFGPGHRRIDGRDCYRLRRRLYGIGGWRLVLGKCRTGNEKGDGNQDLAHRTTLNEKAGDKSLRLFVFIAWRAQCKLTGVSSFCTAAP